MDISHTQRLALIDAAMNQNLLLGQIFENNTIIMNFYYNSHEVDNLILTVHGDDGVIGQCEIRPGR